MRHPGHSLSRQQILDYVWSFESDVQATMVDVYVSYLRRKLYAPDQPDPISTCGAWAIAWRRTMFRGLHVRLTLTYMVVALLLIALVGFGTYALLVQYFQSGTDLALQHEMVTEFRNYNKPLTTDLASAEQVWDAHRVPQLQGADGPNVGDASGDAAAGPGHPDLDDAYNADLAAIFVIPMSSDGTVINDEASATLPMNPNLDAFNNALTNGTDWRTTTLSNGERVRLLTYRSEQRRGGSSGNSDGPHAGRPGPGPLARLLLVLLALGGASAVVLGAAVVAGSRFEAGTGGLGEAAIFRGERQPRTAHATSYNAS